VRTESSQDLDSRFEALQKAQVSKHARCCRNGKARRPNSIDLPELDGGGDYDLLQLEPSGDGLVSLILRKRA